MDGDFAGLELRKAGPADTGALVDLRIDFMRIVKDSGLEDEGGWRAELSARFAADLESGELAAWLCVDGGAAVAASGLGCPAAPEARAELDLKPGEALVLNMYTRPAYRRRGIGAELLRLAIAEARARGASSLRLQPTEDSRRLYERAGFRDSGRDMVLAL
jgi:GNAT superfamily N-acetyltransferase